MKRSYKIVLVAIVLPAAVGLIALNVKDKSFTKLFGIVMGCSLLFSGIKALMNSCTVEAENWRGSNTEYKGASGGLITLTWLLLGIGLLYDAVWGELQFIKWFFNSGIGG